MNSNIKNEIDNEWETDEEETQFLRLNIENASKIKNEIYKRKKYHNKKIKRLEKKEIESANEIEKYIKNNILSKIIIKTDINNDKPYLSIGENEFLINDKPEVGTNVFFSYNEDKRKLEILGKSERFFPKKNPPIKKQKINIQKLKKNKNNNSGDIDTEIDTSKKSDNEMIKNKNNINKNIKMIGNKRKRKPKRKYIKESTIINIKKIE